MWLRRGGLLAGWITDNLDVGNQIFEFAMLNSLAAALVEVTVNLLPMRLSASHCQGFFGDAAVGAAVDHF